MSMAPFWYRAMRSGAATIVTSSTASRPPKPVRSAGLPAYSSGVTRIAPVAVPPLSDVLPMAGASSDLVTSSSRIRWDVLVWVKTFCRPFLRVTLS